MNIEIKSVLTLLIANEELMISKNHAAHDNLSFLRTGVELLKFCQFGLTLDECQYCFSIFFKS